MPESEVTKKQLIIEGKTKQIWELDDARVLVVSKDRITAGDGVRAHEMPEKSKISTQTTVNIFTILNDAGIRTAFLRKYDKTSFIAKRCTMVPIEWVARRVATGSYLRRFPGIKEGFRFHPTKIESFLKDDEAHDPFWSEEQIVAKNFRFNNKLITEVEVDVMRYTTRCIFEILEKYWWSENCTLVDLKVEFGITNEGEIVLSDVIDNDSWRLWLSGDKKLMKDKQLYRDLQEVKEADIINIKENFKWVAEKTDKLRERKSGNIMVVIIMGSKSDECLCQSIGEKCHKLGVPSVLRVASAHKTTESVLKIISEYDSNTDLKVVYIAVAGRSNGLGLVISGNSASPVINCPPLTEASSRDIWSSLSVPSGIGCTTVLYPEAAALAAAHILGIHSCLVWSKLKAAQLQTIIKQKTEDLIFVTKRESVV